MFSPQCTAHTSKSEVFKSRNKIDLKALVLGKRQNATAFSYKVASSRRIIYKIEGIINKTPLYRKYNNSKLRGGYHTMNYNNLTQDDIGLDVFKHRLTWELLLETSRDISSVLDLDNLLTLISQRAVALLNADDCVIFRLEEDGVSLCPIMARGEVAAHSMGCPLQVGQGFTGYSVAINKPLMVNHAELDPHGFHVPGTPVEEEEHLLVTPLSFRGNIIGALLVNRVDKTPFTEEEFRLFNGLASQVAIAIENARLYEKLERYTHVLESTVEERTAQVQQQARWLETILHTVQDALIVTDCNGTIRMANPAALRITGQSDGDLQGKPVQPVLEQLTGDNIAWSGELPTPLRGPVQMGSDHYQYSVAIFEDIQTGRSGYVFLLTDVTPLQRLNNLKSQMIRIASHDLRSPMTSMGLQCHMIRRSLDKNPERIAGHIDRLEQSLAELKSMVSDLLDVERIEQQASGFSNTIEVQLLVTSAVSMIKPQFEQKDHQLTVSIEDNMPVLCGDPVRLLEAIRNLLTNAHKYTPNGGKIDVKLHHNNEDTVRLTVHDTGLGLNSDDRLRVFEPHFRSQDAVESQIEGQGIGLSLVKAIIEEHGGCVFVDSEPGKGSVFGFELPVTVNQTCMTHT